MKIRGEKELDHFFGGVLAVVAVLIAVTVCILGMRSQRNNKQPAITAKKGYPVTAGDQNFLNLVCALAEVIKATKP